MYGLSSKMRSSENSSLPVVASQYRSIPTNPTFAVLIKTFFNISPEMRAVYRDRQNSPISQIGQPTESFFTAKMEPWRSIFAIITNSYQLLPSE
jgi:hypothetical protein